MTAGQTIEVIRDALITRINADATTSSTVLASAGAGDGAIILTAKATGTGFTASGTTTGSGTITFVPTVSYAPKTSNINFNGLDTFTYTVQDADGNQATAAVSIDVTPVIDAPEATTSIFAAF